MNRSLIAAIPLVATVLLSSLVSRAAAQSTTFVCGSTTVNAQAVPTTIAVTPEGDVPVIRWISTEFSAAGFTPQRRCEIVSEKFQIYYSNGSLQYLTTGRINNQPVVCTARTNGGACENQLFTLRPDANPGQTLQRLLDVRNRVGGPLAETGERVYINMNEFLSSTYASSSDSPIPEPAAPSVSEPADSGSSSSLSPAW